jgi:hypothetical protein
MVRLYFSTRYDTVAALLKSISKQKFQPANLGGEGGANMKYKL